MIRLQFGTRQFKPILALAMVAAHAQKRSRGVTKIPKLEVSIESGADYLHERTQEVCNNRKYRISDLQIVVGNKIDEIGGPSMRILLRS